MTNMLIISVNPLGTRTQLRQALQLCENDRCRLQLRAALNRDVGTVLAGYLNATHHDEAVSAFVDALKLDASTTPNRGLPTYKMTSSTVEPTYAEAQQAFARWFWRRSFELLGALFTHMIAWLSP